MRKRAATQLKARTDTSDLVEKSIGTFVLNANKEVDVQLRSSGTECN
jgi:hypothetical protein